MPERHVRPWWRRYPEWWASQRAQLRAPSLHGKLITDGKFAKLHIQRWQGHMVNDQGEVPLIIEWGPGTPFGPPLLKCPGLHSQQHQLSDGTLCLLPPESTQAGYSGAKDIQFWLTQTREWIRRYAKEGWAMDPLLWTLAGASRPGPGYRTLNPEARVLLLPPVWEAGAPGVCGLLEVRAPKSGRGLAAVVGWSAGTSARRWEQGEALVQDPITLGGVWMDMSLLLASQLSRGALVELASGLRTLLDASESAGQPMVLLNRTSMGWSAFQAPVSDLRGFADQVFTLEDLNMVHRGRMIPLVFDPKELEIRRRAGREADMHERITNARVLLVGLGALGSEVAHLLAQEGVRHFELMDGDLLLPGNVTRHRADLSMAGLPKVEAVKRLIQRVNPEAEVQTHQGWFDERLPKLRGLVPGTVLVGATGSEEQELILGDAALELEVPCLHAWLELQGRVLRVVRVVPGRDPALLEVATRSPSPILRLADAAPAPGACVELVLPGAPMDLHAAANFTARRVLDLVLGGAGAANHWLFTPCGVSDVPELPGGLHAPFGLIAEAVPP